MVVFVYELSGSGFESSCSHLNSQLLIIFTIIEARYSHKNIDHWHAQGKQNVKQFNLIRLSKQIMKKINLSF